MAIDDLPGPVVTFLNVIGVPWPYINEDAVMQFAALTRNFATAVQATHEDTTSAFRGIAQGYQSVASEQMMSGWQELSDRHVSELITACHILADALDAAAGYIVAQKAAAIGDLIGMASAFLADQAAAVATLGLAEAAVPAIIAAGRALMESLVQDIVQYITGRVVEAALKPLLARVSDALSGLDWSKTTPIGKKPQGFTLHRPTVEAGIAALDQHAQSFRAHAAAFRAGIEALDF
jgi:hypothetical protein